MTKRGATSETPPSEVVDQDLLGAARVLRETLVRVHPSFRFEERLAARLTWRAQRGRVARGFDAPDTDALDADAGRAIVIPFAIPGAVGAFEGLPGAFDEDPRLRDPRPVTAMRRRAERARGAWWVQVPRGALIGGAIASGFSIAGAALLARRWRHRPTRAVASSRGAA